MLFLGVFSQRWVKDRLLFIKEYLYNHEKINEAISIYEYYTSQKLLTDESL